LNSFFEININDPKTASKYLNSEIENQNMLLNKIKNKIEVHSALPQYSRKMFAVDSGFNNAYESPFTLIKSAVVDEKINVEIIKKIYLFHASNVKSERLKRLLMQINLYKSIEKKIERINEKSIFLVDGTITLSVFSPTPKDGSEYQNIFNSFVEEIYNPLVKKCLNNDILLVGFLKRTGSMFLSKQTNLEIYDIYIINEILNESGDYIKPVLMSENKSRHKENQEFVTFFVNLKDWNYRFELIQKQKNYYLDCIENILFWSTRTHYGMNPIFSKADEYSRVTKKEVEILFNQVLSNLNGEQKLKLRMRAKKKTHFGFGSKDSIKKLK
jgi:hypothetical protein